jgi:hypothetical protein
MGFSVIVGGPYSAAVQRHECWGRHTVLFSVVWDGGRPCCDMVTVTAREFASEPKRRRGTEVVPYSSLNSSHSETPETTLSARANDAIVISIGAGGAYVRRLG